jgi:hypothetical protein
MDHAMLKVAQYLVGCAQVVVNIGQCVISSLTVGRGNLQLYKIELKNFCENFSSKFQRILDDMEEEDIFQCLIQATTEG